MKVVVISQKDLAQTTSGVPRIVHQEIRYFNQAGYKVFAIAETIDNEAVRNSGGIPIKTLKWPISGLNRRKFYNWQVKRFIRRVSADIVIGHGDIIHQDIAFIHNCVHLAHKRIHGTSIPSNHQVAKIHEEILSQQQFKKLVCNSNLMKNELSRRFNIPDEKLITIYPEYDSQKFNFTQRDVKRSKKREFLGFKKSHFVISMITSGNFKKRNVKLIIDIAQEIVKKYPHIRFLIAGKNKNHEYQQRLTELQLDQYFVFAPSIKEVEDYYYASDLFILPALIEEFGMSVLEAMACGCPVIVSNMVGSNEILPDISKRFILKELSCEELIQSIEVIMNDNELRKRLIEQNIQTAKQYDHVQQAKKFDRLISELF